MSTMSSPHGSGRPARWRRMAVLVLSGESPATPSGGRGAIRSTCARRSATGRPSAISLPMARIPTSCSPIGAGVSRCSPSSARRRRRPCHWGCHRAGESSDADRHGGVDHRRALVPRQWPPPVITIIGGLAAGFAVLSALCWARRSGSRLAACGSTMSASCLTAAP